MIRVCVRRVSGQIRQVTISGHACSAPSGEDLICAAVSVLAQTYLFSLRRLLGIRVKARKAKGYLKLELPLDLPVDAAGKATLLADSMLVGLDEINRSYPGYIDVREEEEVNFG